VDSWLLLRSVPRGRLCLVEVIPRPHNLLCTSNMSLLQRTLSRRLQLYQSLSLSPTGATLIQEHQQDMRHHLNISSPHRPNTISPHLPISPSPLAPVPTHPMVATLPLYLHPLTISSPTQCHPLLTIPPRPPPQLLSSLDPISGGRCTLPRVV